ncbi:MAG: prephenate dehydrogenase/arogenate dehydrogenase family protein [Acidobacteria bacterium]|nr:prephenate dehydrogenase/arogenate dehydrogenase family protein [Acidobacteriota bacterium]
MTRVALLGVGLIGGSLGLALRAAHPGHHVTGWDPDPQALRLALARGALEQAAPGAAAAVAGAELVVLCAPLDGTLALLREIRGALAPGSVVTDVAGAKRVVLDEARRALGEGAAFVGGHPLAGSERAGVDAASATLFRDAAWALCPLPGAPPAALARVEALVRAAGARPLVLGAEAHDRAVAYVSHLPQVIARALAAGLATRGPAAALAAGGFRSATRVAASPAALWRPVLEANRDAVAAELDEFADRLRAVARELREGRGPGPLYS